MAAKKRDIVIAGYSETAIDFKTGRSAFDLGGEALAKLLAGTGVPKDAIDGLSVTTPLSECPNPFFAVYMTEALGLTPTWLNYGGTGGCSATGGVARAASAIRDGHCEVVVVLSADAPSTAWRANYGAYRSEFQDPPGVQGPPATFGLLMSRYNHQFGIKSEALGKIAITQREHALHNENAYAKFKTPITMADYEKSRVIADPLRLLDCVMFCDGANAFLVTTEEKARSLGITKMVFPTAYAEVTNFNGNQPLSEITETGFSAIAPMAAAPVPLTATPAPRAAKPVEIAAAKYARPRANASSLAACCAVAAKPVCGEKSQTTAIPNPNNSKTTL